MNHRLRSYVIPGLAMAAKELPDVNELSRLENPEIGSGIKLDREYTIQDIAKLHLDTILSHLEQCEMPTAKEPLQILGMSMGSMILSILATTYRDLLPEHVRFIFLVTSPNLKDHPAIKEETWNFWLTAKAGQVEDFKRILRPFFATAFLKSNQHVLDDYAHYRANGKNQQSAKAFFRQVHALRNFDGSTTFTRLKGKECLFIGGGQDLILGPDHNHDLKKLAPDCTHIEIPDLGHMINLERPDIFRNITSRHVVSKTLIKLLPMQTQS